MKTQRIAETLRKRGEQLLAAPMRPITFSHDPEADALINDLEHHPHAFVLACIVDRQIKAERAWQIPHAICKRLGTFAFSRLWKLTVEEVSSLMRQPVPLHRFPDVMSKIFHAGIQRIAGSYSGDAARMWSDCPSSAGLIRRFLEFDGVGPKIASMAANILVRDFKIAVSDKCSIDVSADVHVRRVFARLGLVPPERKDSADIIIYRARELNPEYPGVFDLSAWEIGRQWCRPRDPSCADCYMRSLCPSALQGRKPPL